MHAKDVRLASPCTLDWQKMTKVEGGRFCGDCKKVVRDLSSMREDEARALLAQPPSEGLCVRYLYDKHGRVFFAGDAKSGLLPASLLSRAKRAAAIASLAAPLAACSFPDAMSKTFASDRLESTSDPHESELQPAMGGIAADPRYDARDAAADDAAAAADTDASTEADADAAPSDDDAGYQGPY